MKKGTLYFFTGLAGAGKTTIGGLFYRRLKARKNDVILFDGEQMRPVYGSDYGYSTEDRLKSAKMEFRLCKLLTDQGLDVVCCAMRKPAHGIGRTLRTTARFISKSVWKPCAAGTPMDYIPEI